MKEIYDKEYVQFLQQMTDKPEKEYFLEEVKRQQLVNKLYLDNTIELDDFLKYSN